MKMLEDIDRRLRNWARWKRGGASGGLGYSGVNWSSLGAIAGAASTRYREAVLPTSDAEAAVTDAAVMSLVSEQRAAVEAHYLGNGSQRQTAARLACSQGTVRTRILKAQLAINAWLMDRKAAADAERLRVERLQQAARP